jgi:hypothetical protein
MSLAQTSGGSSESVVYRGGYYPYSYYDNRASTPAEGYARGMADVLRARGRQNLLNSEAAINATEARKRAIDNREKWTDTYFRLRKKNREYRAQLGAPRLSEEDWIRYAQQGKPERLSPSELDAVSGQIRWPILLRDERFSEERNVIQNAFAERASTGSLSRDDLLAVNDATDAILAALKDDIRQLPPDEYMQTKNFVESIAYEARMPVN